MDKCPKCGADNNTKDRAYTPTKLQAGRKSIFGQSYQCGSVSWDNGEFGRTERCLRRQLAAVTAEMDEWRERRDNLKQTCDDRGVALEKAEAERDRLREALGQLINDCDLCPTYERGVGGMTVEAQTARTYLRGLPIFCVERARSALKGDADGQDD